MSNCPGVSGWIYLDIHPEGEMKIGSDCRFNSGAGRNPVARNQKASFFIGKNAKVIIGDGVGISNSTIVATDNISIGSFSLIGAGCTIVDTDFHSIDFVARQQRPDPSVARKPVSIGTNVFIGAFSVILKGVTIGDRAVIGAGSVVVRNVLSDELWAGNPAQFKRKLN